VLRACFAQVDSDYYELHFAGAALLRVHFEDWDVAAAVASLATAASPDPPVAVAAGSPVAFSGAAGDALEARRRAALKWWAALKARVPRQVAALVDMRLAMRSAARAATHATASAPPPRREAAGAHWERRGCGGSGALDAFAAEVLGATRAAGRGRGGVNSGDGSSGGGEVAVMVGGSVDLAEALLAQMAATDRLHFVGFWSAGSDSGDSGGGEEDEGSFRLAATTQFLWPDGTWDIAEAEDRLSRIPPCSSWSTTAAPPPSRARFVMASPPTAVAGWGGKWLPAAAAASGGTASGGAARGVAGLRLGEDRSHAPPGTHAAGRFRAGSVGLAFVAVAPGEVAWGGAEGLLAALRAWYATLRPGGVLCGSNHVDGFLPVANARFATADALQALRDELTDGGAEPAPVLHVGSRFDPLVDFAPGWWIQKPW